MSDEFMIGMPSEREAIRTAVEQEIARWHLARAAEWDKDADTFDQQRQWVLANRSRANASAHRSSADAVASGKYRDRREG